MVIIWKVKEMKDLNCNGPFHTRKVFVELLLIAVWEEEIHLIHYVILHVHHVVPSFPLVRKF